jgi:hypothetical protein
MTDESTELGNVDDSFVSSVSCELLRIETPLPASLSCHTEWE